MCVQEQPLIYRHFKNGVIFSDDETEVALQLLLTGCLRGINSQFKSKADSMLICTLCHNSPLYSSSLSAAILFAAV